MTEKEDVWAEYNSIAAMEQHYILRIKQLTKKLEGTQVRRREAFLVAMEKLGYVRR